MLKHCCGLAALSGRLAPGHVTDICLGAAAVAGTDTMIKVHFFTNDLPLVLVEVCLPGVLIALWLFCLLFTFSFFLYIS